MDLSAGKRQLTNEERARRLAEGLCMYCGGQGHLARTCPSMARRNLRLNAALVQNPDPAPVEEEAPEGPKN